ncbi:MAG TPA: heme ABC exporter ATP-binding protein CcmA [Candidatus Binatia bacterium]|nr:heme ABC exporter ATP-binding protein CcmA [Candidatus Binatia bacterium]
MTVKKLSKAYGFFWALKDLNLDLPPGELVALLGPNGAGKTTLLKLIAGLIPPSLGKIELDRMPFSHANGSSRAQIGLLAPAAHLYEDLTVRENLEFFTSLYGWKQDAGNISSALASVDLSDRADEFVSTLSSGMKCRLSIAKWALLNPGLLLLDEPYGVLDGSGVDLLEEFLKAHCRKGNLVILASHHVSRVLKICSRAIILHQGRMTFNAPRQQPWPDFDQAFREFLPHGDA